MDHYSFRSTILILPGLGDSGELHWQSLWQKRFAFERIIQKDWDTPSAKDWITTIQAFVLAKQKNDIILVGHSLACNAIVKWAEAFQLPVKAAMLVAPSDTEAPSYPAGTSGFVPMPLKELAFPSITVASTNDPYVSIERATYFANTWGSKLINIGDAGHINAMSGHGSWEEGLLLLSELDKL